MTMTDNHVVRIRYSLYSWSFVASCH